MQIDWQAWNSPNHGGEGQNALYADSHAEFVETPLAGVNDDNIYTRWPDAVAADVLARIHGTRPTKNETPFSSTDTLVYP